MVYELMNCGAGVGNHQVTEWADLKSVGKTACNGAKSCPDGKYVDGWERPPAQSLQTYNGHFNETSRGSGWEERGWAQAIV